MKALYVLVMCLSLVGMVVLAIATIGECLSYTSAAIIFLALFDAGFIAAGKIVE